MRKALSLLLFVLPLCTGCYGSFGMIKEERITRSKVTHSEEIVGEIISEGVRLSSEVEGQGVIIRAERIAYCQTLIREHSTSYEEVTRTLPDSHWIVLTSGAAFLIGGGVMTSIGLSNQDELEGIEVGDPDQERTRDQGDILVTTGLISLGIGAVLGISEIVDLARAQDSSTPAQTLSRDTPSEVVECIRAPSVNQEITVSTESGKAYLHLNESGQRLLKRGDSPLDESLLLSHQKKVVVTCEGCDTLEVAIP